jgi:hypothetical protein
MTNSLANLVQSIPDSVWKTGAKTDSSSGALIRWVPLFGARGEEYPQIGLSSDGEWVAASVGRVMTISLDSAAWLLALDYSLGELRSITDRKLAAYGVVSGLLPYESIVSRD